MASAGKGTISTLAKKAKSVWKTFFSKTESPREIQERNDLYKIALATTFRKLRLDYSAYSKGQDEGGSDSGDGDDILSSFSTKKTTSGGGSVSVSGNGNCNRNEDVILCRNETTKAELETLYDRAADSLETEMKLYEMPLRALRHHCQSLIQPQAINLLTKCREIDTNYNFQHGYYDDEVDANAKVDVDGDEHTHKMEKICKGFLLQEREDVLGAIEHHSHSSANNNKSTKYLRQKLEALQIISAFYEWENDYLTAGEGSDSLEEGKADAFGYYMNQDEEINKSIRYYQMINLTKALLIKKHLGYAPLALNSTAQGAGRGVFLDGFAPAGSLISFFPGRIWPKEYLLNVKAASAIFENDPKQQLSLRYDDTLVDSRKAPYTVLDDVNSNAFSVGHIVNHPPQLTLPNCSTTMIDFMEHMELDKVGLGDYIPNTYVKPPMMFGPNAMDREKVSMHSFGLIASRDLENEELFYDYLLSPGAGAGGESESESDHPSWYHVCDEESLKNRWDSSS